MEKVYIFADVETAKAFKLTASWHFGYDGRVTRIGTALIMPDTVYNHVMENTYAIAAALIATVDEKP